MNIHSANRERCYWPPISCIFYSVYCVAGKSPIRREVSLVFAIILRAAVFAAFPYQSASTTSWQNYSAWCKIPASSIVNKASSVKLTLQFTAGTSATIGAIRLFATAPWSPTVVSRVAMMIGGSPSPTIVIPAGTSSSNPFLVTTDAATITIDGKQDIYIVAYFANAANNASVGVSSRSMGSETVFGTYQAGDQTAMTNVATSLGTAAMTGTSTMNLFNALLVAP